MQDCNEEPKRVGSQTRWGLIPLWAKAASLAPLSLASKPVSEERTQAEKSR